MADKKTVDSWMEELGPSLREIAQTLRLLVLQAVPDVSESIKWGVPCYERSGKVCYLAANKGHINLGFFNGAGLNNPDGLIEGTGEKMRHVKVRKPEDIRPDVFAALVQEAVRLNTSE
jgi:hypothetical protein